MNKDLVDKIRASSVWDREFKDFDDVLENGILKSDDLPEIGKAIQSIVRTGDIIKSYIEQFLSKFDLSIAQKSVLDTLFFSKCGYLTQNEISKFMYTSKANVSSILDRMESKGLIKREENKENRREKKVMLTKKGEELLYLTSGHEQFDAVLNSISDEESKKIINITKKLREKISKLK